MKKNGIFIFAGVVVVAVVGIAIVSPPPFASDSAGTIGKVSKYRDSNMSQDEIVLRNALMEDAEALQGTIETLDFYGNYLSGLANDCGEWKVDLEQLELSQEELSELMPELGSLKSFLDNNLSMVSETKALLEKYQSKETVDKTVDVQNHLIQFGDFVSNLSKKDKVLDSLFVTLDGMIDKEDLQSFETAQQLNKDLATVREKMLGALLINGRIMGNTERLNLVLSRDVVNFSLLNQTLNGFLIGFYCAKSNTANAIPVLGKDTLNRLFSQENVLGVYSKANAGKSIDSSSQLELLYGSKDFVSVFHGKELGSLVDFEKLGVSILNKDQLGYIRNKEQLGYVRNKEDLGVLATSNLSSAASFARSLGVSW